MARFTDEAGNIWVVAVNVAQCRKVRTLLGIDLPKLMVPPAGEKNPLAALAEFLSDPIQVVDTLFVLCEAEAKERNINDEAFGRGMAGDVLEQARDAFLEAYADFFPAAKAKSLRGAIREIKKVDDILRAHGEKAIAEFKPETAAAEILRTFGESSTNTPASSGSSRGRSRSES